MYEKSWGIAGAPKCPCGLKFPTIPLFSAQYFDDYVYLHIIKEEFVLYQVYINMILITLQILFLNFLKSLLMEGAMQKTDNNKNVNKSYLMINISFS